MLSVVVRPNSYQDSVALMLLSRQLSDLPGVAKASVMMGTPANKQILAETGFADPAVTGARPAAQKAVSEPTSGLLGGLPVKGLPTHGLPVNGIPLG